MQPREQAVRAGQGLVTALREVPGRGPLAGLDLADQRGRVAEALAQLLLAEPGRGPPPPQFGAEKASGLAPGSRSRVKGIRLTLPDPSIRRGLPSRHIRTPARLT